MISSKVKWYKRNVTSIMLVSFFSLFSPYAFSQNDTLDLKNKDRIIGKIKKLDAGVLSYSTNYSSGDLKIKWKQVKRIKSARPFMVTLTNGKRIKVDEMFSGTDDNEIILKKDTISKFINISDLVFIKPLKQDFMSKLNASVSFGYNFTKGSSLQQLTLAGKLGYTGDFWNSSISFNSSRSKQDNAEEIQRTYADFLVNYALKGDHYVLYQAEFLSNSEQKLKLRITNKAGLGKYFVHTNRMYLTAGAGVAWNNEEYLEIMENNRNSGEAFGAVEISLFDFSNISFLSGFTVYPSITEKDRVRADFKMDLKYNLPLDLFIKLGFNYNYDNQPVENGASDDYIIRTTLGWSL